MTVEREYRGGPADLLIALHARKSHASVVRFHQERPDGWIVVALTGTDLYQDLARARAARESVELADRLVTLQRLALQELWPSARRKARVIHQSAPALRRMPPLDGVFEVLVLGHLRPVKDPFRTALASRLLPRQSAVRVIQVGRALSEPMRRRAVAEGQRNPRYVWLGERPRAQAVRLLRRAKIVVLTSKSEGGANVVSEAVRSGVPILSSRIPGSVGLLGSQYPGYFPVGDTRALARLLTRAERDAAFLERLVEHGRKLHGLFSPEREQASWESLFAELNPPARPAG